MWGAGYALLVVLTLVCASILWRSPAVVSPPLKPGPSKASAPAGDLGGLSLTRRVRWLLLSFVPSSLMMGVTTYLSTDIAAVPLLWVIPLAIYLLTFVFVFAKRPPLPHRRMLWALPLVVLPLTVLVIIDPRGPMWMLALSHLVTFFVAAMVCHGELSKDRPPTRYLTKFYLWMALGGVSGGLFNLKNA